MIIMAMTAARFKPAMGAKDCMMLPPVIFLIRGSSWFYNNCQKYVPIEQKPFGNRFASNFAVFCIKALGKVKRKILNSLRAIARVFKI
jgi:hypothetical protein